MNKDIDLDKYLTQEHYSDIECVGFWEDVKTIDDVHVLCSVTEDDKVLLFHDNPEFDNVKVWDGDDKMEYTIPERVGSLIDGFRMWYKIGRAGGKLSIHNLSTYDKGIIEKVVPKCIIPLECYRDTFTQSKVQFFDRPCPKGAKSGHSLLAYGIKFGVKKPPITDFRTMTPYILHRVIEDCVIQKKTQLYLDKEASLLLEKGIDFTEALVIEDEYARGCEKQVLRGILVDQPHMHECIKLWDEKSEAIALDVEPQLPMTVNANTARTTRSEMMKALGYKKIPTDLTHMVKKDGVMVLQPVKPYYTPSVNFHRVAKVNRYYGFNMSCGASPEYIKKADLTKWIKKNFPQKEYAPKYWDIEKEIVETKLLNKNTYEYFGVEETDTDIICGPHTRLTFKDSTMSQYEVVKGFLIKLGLKYVDEWNFKKNSDKQIIRADHDMVVSYPPKAHPDNQLHFTVKKGEGIVTSPKVGEKDYEQLPEGLGQKIGEYNTTVHRRRFLSNPSDPDNKGLLAYIREDGRLPAGVNNFGTSTGRASHRIWVNAAGPGSLYGEEIRKCIIAPKGRKLVGADMKSAQLAIAAFLAKNSTYYDAVASGQTAVKNEDGVEVYVGESAHCYSARNFGLVSQEEWKEAVLTQCKELLHSIELRRKKSKSSSFGVIFGCSGKKLAGMLGIDESQGNEKKNNFLREMGLDDVIEALKGCKTSFARGRGWYIPLPMGYWVFCTSDHKNLNYIVQGLEAFCQKIAVNWFNKEIVNTGLDGFQVLDYHR